MFPEFDLKKFSEADKKIMQQVMIDLRNAYYPLDEQLSAPARSELDNTIAKLEDVIVDMEFALDLGKEK